MDPSQSIGEPLSRSKIQERDCTAFAARRAIIIHQADYSLTRLVDKSLHDLNATKNDAVDATEIAHGFGIDDCHITYINDMSLSEMLKSIF